MADVILIGIMVLCSLVSVYLYGFSHGTRYIKMQQDEQKKMLDNRLPKR